MPPSTLRDSLSSSLVKRAMASNLPYWKPLYKVGVSWLLCQVLEDQLNMIEVPSAGGYPPLVMSQAMWCDCSGAEVLGELLAAVAGWA